MFIPFKKATVLVPSGPRNDPEKKHLFIVLTDPFDSGFGKKYVLLVSVSSIKNKIPYDKTCILNPGDHSFIKRRSFIYYGRSRIEDAMELIDGVKDNKLIPCEPLEQNIFSSVCEGVYNSPQTPRGIIEFYRMTIESVSEDNYFS
ncbi:MAG: hypothetical protein H7833_20715 [Magnetococcus sp. DMHC-1]|nr:hypothetical protein [Magnetococcales bacterium]